MHRAAHRPAAARCRTRARRTPDELLPSRLGATCTLMADALRGAARPGLGWARRLVRALARRRWCAARRVGRLEWLGSCRCAAPARAPCAPRRAVLALCTVVGKLGARRAARGAHTAFLPFCLGCLVLWSLHGAQPGGLADARSSLQVLPDALVVEARKQQVRARTRKLLWLVCFAASVAFALRVPTPLRRGRGAAPRALRLARPGPLVTMRLGHIEAPRARARSAAQVPARLAWGHPPSRGRARARIAARARATGGARS